jgi:DNA-binding SARP family transcriptional activator
MSTLNICLLGDMRLQSSLRKPIVFPTRKSKSLLAYLVVHRQRKFTRTTLAGKFWPETEEARAQRSLNTELWRLRTMLKGSGLEPQTYLHSDRDSIGFRCDSDHWVDVAEFDDLTRPLTTPHDILKCPQLLPSLRKAIVLYRGDFVEGVFDDWCLVQREDYRVRLMAALETLLAAAMEERCWDEAIVHGRRLLEIDPLLEHVHRALMRCYLSLGNRPAALKQYAACRRALRDELQIEPMEETRQLLEKVIAHSADPRSNALAGLPRLRTMTPAQRIDAALAKLSSAHALLEDASRRLRSRDPD